MASADGSLQAPVQAAKDGGGKASLKMHVDTAAGVPATFFVIEFQHMNGTMPKGVPCHSQPFKLVARQRAKGSAAAAGEGKQETLHYAPGAQMTMGSPNYVDGVVECGQWGKYLRIEVLLDPPISNGDSLRARLLHSPRMSPVEVSMAALCSLKSRKSKRKREAEGTREADADLLRMLCAKVKPESLEAIKRCWHESSPYEREAVQEGLSTQLSDLANEMQSRSTLVTVALQELVADGVVACLDGKTLFMEEIKVQVQAAVCTTQVKAEEPPDDGPPGFDLDELLALTTGLEPLPVRFSSSADEDLDTSYRSLSSSEYSESPAKAPWPAGRSPLQVVESVLAAVNKALASL